jgi:hypothetical protein
MKHNVMLTVSSLLAILAASVHIAHDVARGVDKPGLNNVTGVLILVVWLCGALLLAERRTGLVILLLGSILAAGIPVLHWSGAGVNAQFVKSTAGFFYMWTLYLLGVSGAFSFILSVLGLLRMRSATPRV